MTKQISIKLARNLIYVYYISHTFLNSRPGPVDIFPSHMCGCGIGLRSILAKINFQVLRMLMPNMIINFPVG